MVPKFKLKVIRQVALSPRRVVTVQAEFVWDSREDALSCKKLLERATPSKGTRVEIVEFSEETQL